MIDVIFGKKGSGKTTLSKQLMRFRGGKVCYFSPVDFAGINPDYIIWDFQQAKNIDTYMHRGDIAVVQNVDDTIFSAIILNAIIHKDYTIVIDEIEYYRGNEYLEKIIHYGRHYNIHLIVNTRRYTGVPRLLSSQADSLYIFQTNEPVDIKYLTEYMSREHVTTIQNLPKYHYFQYPERIIRSTKL